MDGATTVSEDKAREAHSMFRRSNLKHTQKIHPLFARGSSEQLTLTLFEDRIATSMVINNDQHQASRGCLVDAKLSKVAAFVFCKNKFYLFLSSKSSHVRLSCHCFCMPSKDQILRLACALPKNCTVMHLPEKGHRRAQSLPTLSLSPSEPFLSSRLSTFPTMMDLSSPTDMDTDVPSPSCSQRSSMSQLSQLHLSSAYMSKVASHNVSPSTSLEDLSMSDDESIELEMFSPPTSAGPQSSTVKFVQDSCEHCGEPLAACPKPCACLASVTYVGAREVRSNESIDFVGLCEELEATSRRQAAFLCVNARGFFLQDVQLMPLFCRSLDNIASVATVGPYIVVSYVITARKQLVQVLHSECVESTAAFLEERQVQQCC